MKHLELLKEAEENRLKLYRYSMDKTVRGLCIGNNIILNKDIDSIKEFNCILAEEIGHYKTTVGDITSPGVNNARQELRARAYAYDKLIGLEGLVEAWDADCRSINEAAEYLSVTEDFFKAALEYYRGKYGVQTSYKDRLVTLIPCLKVEDRG